MIDHCSYAYNLSSQCEIKAEKNWLDTSCCAHLAILLQHVASCWVLLAQIFHFFIRDLKIPRFRVRIRVGLPVPVPVPNCTGN